MNRKKRKKGGKVFGALREMLYGATMHGLVTDALRAQMHLNHLFMLITMGDMLGIPIMPPYYTLRLLPYAVPHIKAWEKQLLREQDLIDDLRDF